MIGDRFILIITSLDDGHTDSVIQQLHNTSIPFVRINTDELLNGITHLSWQQENGEVVFKYFNGHRQFIFSNVRSIYYRRPTKPRIEKEISSTYQDVYIDECWSGLHSILFTFSEARWFGHPHLDKVNSSKLAQKLIADEIQHTFKQVYTPDSILANNSSDLISFSEKYPYLVMKPIDSRGVINDDEWIPFFSERISSSDLISAIKEQKYPQLNYCLLQEYIEKKHEWRITVVDQDVFGCLILSQDNEHSKIDWRRIGHEEISHIAAKPPQFIVDFCLKFLNSLKIHFGAFDFIETPDNKFYFLECNVNGQWLWIEECTGQKISKSIADALQHTIS
jgi:hypothetical protein